MRLPYGPPIETPLILAPMAGVSEAPFRQICRAFGADILMTEFLSAEAIRRGVRKTIEGAEFEPCERPIGVQIYGSDPEAMARAAAIVTEAYEPDFLDINFGCPVKKVVKRLGGSGCLQDLGLVERIIRAVARATHLPVTVKTRSGWNELTRQPVEIALRMQDAGARAFTLHARTRTQMFGGSADWDEIARVVEALEIPVIGNGDVRGAGDVRRMRDHTGCAGVMVGRASFGNPWLFRDARALLRDQLPPPAPDAGARFAVAMAHATLALRLQGDSPKTVVEFRKHLGWYTKGLHGAAALRQRLFDVTSMQEAEEIFRTYLSVHAGAPVASAA